MRRKDIFKDPISFWNTAQSFIHSYLPDIRKSSVHTIKAYKDGMNIFISFLEDIKDKKRENICFNDFDNDTIREYQQWMLVTRGKSPRTCNQRISALRAFMEYAASRHKDLTPQFVALKGIKETQTSRVPIEYFEKGQMRALLAAPDTSTKTGRRNQMILILMYDTAARVTEILELKVASLHLQADTPYVCLHGKGDKFRNVPLMKKTVAHLKRYIREFHEDSDETAPLFYAMMHGKRHALSDDTVSAMLKSSANRASITTRMPERCHCHMIRKTRAMDLYQAGMSLPHIQQLLGHEDISTTSGFYAFATLDTLAKAIEKITPPTDEDPKWHDPAVVKRLYTL